MATAISVRAIVKKDRITNTISGDSKPCSRCCVEKSTDEFRKQASTKDGLQHQCKVCAKQYEYSHKEEIATRQTAYNDTVNGCLRRTFSRMKSRCTDTSRHNYHRYGGRGVRVCFESVEEFIDYVVNTLKVDPRGLTIDRIDNDGNYERGNIRFATQAANNLNR
jgi:hypothetical protein